MTGKKFTEGPWGVLYHDLNGVRYGILGVIAEGDDDEGNQRLLEIKGSGGARSFTAYICQFEGTEDDAANAHLIAAAPELYEALLEARAYVPEHHGPVNHKIESALAKARGETP